MVLKGIREMVKDLELIILMKTIYNFFFIIRK